MKKITSIRAGLIAAVLFTVLLSGVSTSAMAQAWMRTDGTGHFAHWAPWDGPIQYFFMCTIGQQCEGSKWR